MSDAVRYWALVEGLGLLALPVAATWLGRLPGRGLTLARPLALLLVGYLVWLLASVHLVAYGTVSVVLGVVVLAALSAALLLRRTADGGTLGQLVRRDRAALALWLAGEVLFAVCFFAWALLRSYAPDVWGTEKPMDMAFINAINRSTWFPPNDPWLAGSTINYYYFGHLIVAYLLRLSGVVPTVGFNLGVALLYALSAGGVFAVAATLFAAGRQRGIGPRLSPILPGLTAAAFAMLLGNLDGALELLAKPVPLAGFDWWSPSRVIGSGATINEFPFFSFLLADLHAHMLAVPFGLVALAFSLQLALAGPRLPLAPSNASPDPATGTIAFIAAPGLTPERASLPTPSRASLRLAIATTPGGGATPALLPPGASGGAANSDPITALRLEGPASAGTLTGWLATAGELALAALVVGSLYALNGWDYPTELAIGGLAMVVWSSGRRGSEGRLLPLAGWAAAWTVASFFFFLPFYLHFTAPTRGLGLVHHDSGFMQFLHDYFLIYGVFAWIAGAAFLWRLRRGGIALRYLAWGTITALVVLAALASVKLGGVAVLLTATAFALGAAFDGEEAPPSRLWWLLLAVAIGLATIGELVYVRDAFDGGVNYRMNTVFKFGYQAWFILAVVAGCGVFWSRRWLRQDSMPLWLGGLALLVACAAVYPVAATYAREGAFQASPSLDGMRWLAAQAPGDAAAIRWLQANVRGAPTVLEAVGVQYDPAGHARVSTYTGLPTVVGWPGHEGEWDHSVGTRPEDVKTLYSTTDLNLARAFLQRYGVRYVFVGSLERQDYPAAGLAKFAQLGTPVYASGGTIIYALPLQ